MLCKGIDKVLEVLAKPADVSRDELERDLRTGNVKRAVQQSIADAEVLAQISSSVPGMAGIVVASVGTEQITMLPIDPSRVHTYLLGGDRVVTAELRWQVVRRYTAVTPGVDPTWGIRFNVISTVVMVLRPEDGAFRALHVPHRTVTSIIEQPLDGSAR